MHALVGAGGWAYFGVPDQDSLEAYSEAFPFVEANATFYSHPDPRTVASWRRRVPGAFCFSVRAHHDVTHRFRMRATPAARTSFDRTTRIAARLDAIAVVLQTPETLRFGGGEVHGLTDLIAGADLPCPVVLEARAYAGRSLPKALAAAMEEHGVVDVVDFSRQAPRTESSLAYGRLFGLGEGNRWEFTDDEVKDARRNAESVGAKRIAYTFHGVRMYKDAARFLTFVRTGKFPRATKGVGLASLEEVLRDGPEFPATRSELLASHGFRVVDVTADRRAHASALLADLPPRTYDSPEQVVAALDGSV